MAAFIETSWQVRKRAVRSAGGIVASQSLAAARVGAQVLAEGGNAVDAAVAASFALAATEPWMSGLGGGGFMVVHRPGSAGAEVVDFGMVAPAGLDPADYAIVGGADEGLFHWPRVTEDRNLRGAASVAVPGQVEGMRLALERFGTRPWAALLQPAIALAEAGLEIDWYAALGIAAAAAELALFPATRAVWLPAGLPPMPPPEGGSLRLPLGRLPDTLRRLAAAGPRDFYEGALARAVLADMQAAGGCLAAADLADYRAELLPALEIPYRGVTVATAPGLTAGPSLRAVLERLAARLEVSTAAPDAAAYLAYADALQAAYAERLARMGHAALRPGCTTHLSVVDGQGMMVALTQTLLSRFGSKLLLPETGILMNNGIMWFDPRPGGPNALAPGRRPLSNMCPAILHRGGRGWIALGASGGRRILPAVAQLLSFLVDFGMSLDEAFAQPRLDWSGGEPLTLDPRLPPEAATALSARLRIIEGLPLPYPVLFASPNAVLRDGGENRGLADLASPWSAAVAAAG